MFGRMITSQRFISYQNCNLILDPEEDRGGIYLGDYTAAIDLNLLKSKGIKTVLTVATGLPVQYSKDSGIYHKIYQALDIESYNLAKHFPDTYKQIDEGLMRGNVYVHCAAGISRSSSTVIAYLMKKYGWTYVKAHGFVKGKRPVISPNNGFIRQLRNYERQLKSQQQLSPQNEDGNRQKQSQPQIQIIQEEKVNYLDEDDKLRMIKNMSQSDKKKQFSQSAQKYIPLKNKLNREQEEQKEPLIQPNIITYGAKNNLIVKKNTQFPYLNKQKL